MAVEHIYIDQSVTGWPSNLYRSVSTSIGLYRSKSKYKYIYVGITKRPEGRWYDHLRDDAYLWERCILKYRTTSKDNVNIFEGYFINDHRTVNQYIGYSNMNSEGDGDIFYLYILLANKKKKLKK